ncbi:MAG: hypothetical protein GY754_12940 [bacterium]|nr:hypothetical protein [bacterium]
MRTNILKQLTGFMIVSALVFPGCEAGLTSNDSGGDFSFSEIYSRVDSLYTKMEILEKTNQDQKNVIEAMEQNALTAVTDIQTTIVSLGLTVNGNTAAIGNNTTAINDLSSGSLADLGTIFSGVTRTGNTIVFSGVNVRIVNGSGTTQSTNGLGNLIVGYNDEKTGSHNIVTGDGNNFTSYGGIIGGAYNTASAKYSSILGGFENTASGEYSCISGGNWGTASGMNSSINGGGRNSATGMYSAVSGGFQEGANSNYSIAH